jgi:FKBP-type peptidyl-prolyl cis-trans isomerase FkpA/FKBP-type peptidyl-prolyl cis-trans isomerase FklB
VKVNYTGKLRTARSSTARQQRAAGRLPARPDDPVLDRGISLMKPGGKAEFTCPSDLAYGDAGVPPGSGDRIPGGAALRFEVELLSVEKGAALEPKPADKPPAR